MFLIFQRAAQISLNTVTLLLYLSHIYIMFVIDGKDTGQKNEFPTYGYREDMRMIGQILAVRRICRKFCISAIIS